MKFLGGFEVGAFEGSKPLRMFVAQGIMENLNKFSILFFRADDSYRLLWPTATLQLFTTLCASNLTLAP